jgi:hypothetical protein
LEKRQVNEISSLQAEKIEKLQVVGMAIGQNAKLTKWQIGRMAN